MRARARGWLLPAAAALLVGCDAPGTGPTSAQPSATTIASGSGLPAGSSRISGLKQPFGVATERGATWVTEYEAGNLVRIDTSANRVAARIHIGPHASHVVLKGGFAWVTDDLGGTLISVDTVTNRVGKQIPMRPRPELRPIAIVADAGSIWVPLATNNENISKPHDPPSQLVRVDASTGEVLATISVPGIAAGVEVGGGAVWVVSTLNPIAVYRIDPTAKVITATIDTGHTPSGAMAYLDPYLWVANQDGDLTRIDSRTNRATSFTIGSPEWPALVAQGQAIWISAPLDNIVARFDPATGAISRTVPTGGSRPQIFAFLGNDMWVANYIDGTLVRLPIN